MFSKYIHSYIRDVVITYEIKNHGILAFLLVRQIMSMNQGYDVFHYLIYWCSYLIKLNK